MAAAQRTLRRRTLSVPPSRRTFSGECKVNPRLVRGEATSAFSPHAVFRDSNLAIARGKSHTTSASLRCKPHTGCCRLRRLGPRPGPSRTSSSPATTRSPRPVDQLLLLRHPRGRLSRIRAPRRSRCPLGSRPSGGKPTSREGIRSSTSQEGLGINSYRIETMKDSVRLITSPVTHYPSLAASLIPLP